MRTSAKHIGIFEMYGMSARIRWDEPVRSVLRARRERRRVVNFSRFCADFLYGQSLTLHI